MQPPAHPDPERLAALAGRDADALSDRALAAHVAECRACDQQVRELAAIRMALAELPDLAPSRPLQLVPSVAEPAAVGGWRIMLRRAFAPMVVAGLALMVVGGVGVTGALGPADASVLVERLSFSVAAPAAAPDEAQGPEVQGPTATFVPEGPAATQQPRVSGDSGALNGASPRPSDEQVGVPTDRGQVDVLSGMIIDRSAWVALGAVGMGLLALALVLRRAALPV